MIKFTPRQKQIIDKLADALRKEAGDMTDTVAKGIVQLGLDDACHDLGIELNSVQDRDKAGKIAFNALLLDKIAIRLRRLYLPEERIGSITGKLQKVYEKIM